MAKKATESQPMDVIEKSFGKLSDLPSEPVEPLETVDGFKLLVHKNGIKFWVRVELTTLQGSKVVFKGAVSLRGVSDHSGMEVSKTWVSGDRVKLEESYEPRMYGPIPIMSSVPKLESEVTRVVRVGEGVVVVSKAGWEVILPLEKFALRVFTHDLPGEFH